MTREECKDFIAARIQKLGGIKMDELVALAGYQQNVKDFGAVFHPDMIGQLVLEGKIVEVRYTLPGLDTTRSFLLPKNTKVKVINDAV